jgi:hypothetical protein
VEEDHGDEVTLRHDESGKTSRISKKALASMLHAEHAEALGAVRERASKILEQAKKTGTAKQQEKAAALASKYGVKVEEPTPSPAKFNLGASPSNPPAPFAPRTVKDFQEKNIGAKIRIRGLHGLPPNMADDINAFLTQGGRVVSGNRYYNKAWAESLLNNGIVPVKNATGNRYLIWNGGLDKGGYVYVPLMSFAAEDPPISFIQKRTEWGQAEDARIEAEWQREQEERKRLGLDEWD